MASGLGLNMAAYTYAWCVRFVLANPLFVILFCARSTDPAFKASKSAFSLKMHDEGRKEEGMEMEMGRARGGGGD